MIPANPFDEQDWRHSATQSSIQQSSTAASKNLKDFIDIMASFIIGQWWRLAIGELDHPSNEMIIKRKYSRCLLKKVFYLEAVLSQAPLRCLVGD